MFRTARPHKRRTAASMVAGVVVATALVTGAPSAHAATPTTDLETTVLRISGSTIPAGGTIVSGRTLTPVRLTTSDPETAVGDGVVLNGAVPEVRSRKPRFVIPAVQAEPVTFSIGGITAATTVPDFRAVNLQTDQGTVPAVVFTAGGVSYALPRLGVPVTGVTRTVASSTVNTGTVGRLLTYEYGLLPIGAQPRLGTMFQESSFDATVTGFRTVQRTVFDADAVRGNTDSVSEELVLTNSSGPSVSSIGTGTEVLATVTLRSGATVTARGLRYVTVEAYSQSSTTWAFDRAALAAAGATVADVTGIVSFTVTDHDLTWQDLGFDPI